MARISYTAIVNEIVGSIGGLTFQRNRSGTIVRIRPQTHKNSTTKQTEAHQLLTAFIGDWQKLTLAQQTDWDDFAVLHTKENQFGETKTLTGLNWYISINQNLQRCGEPTVDVPPAHLLPAGNFNYDLSVSQSSIEMDITNLPAPVQSCLFVWTTNPTTRVLASNRGAWRLTLVDTNPALGILDLTSAWETTHGIDYPPSALVNCYKIQVMAYRVRTTSGIAEPGIIKSAATSQQLEGIGFWIIEVDFEVQ